MKIPFINVKILDFTEIDEQIAKLRDLRDSYRAANKAHYGELLAALLDD